MRTIHVLSGEKTELAVVEDGQLCEYLLDAGEGKSDAEGIYVGRVERVVSGMQAAFVDIGQKKNGFLPLSEHSKTCVVPRLQDGMQVLVQVKKQAQGSKGAFLSRDITLCGEYVLLMPLNRYVGVSARVEQAEDREQLKALGQRICGGEYGLVMRQASLTCDEETILDEVNALLARWQHIARTAPTAHVPSLIEGPRTLLTSLLDDYLPRGVDRVVTNDPDYSAVGILTEYRQDPMEGLRFQRDKALERWVWLDCGGSLVIDRCEAMTVIDVNTAKNTGKRDLEQTILRTNLEACREIARQVRLRNVSGIILIDMIDMTDESHREMVLEALRAAFRADRVKTVIHGFTTLGLIEMTRKRSRRPLADDWTAPCRTCRGTGRTPRHEEDEHG